MSARSSLASVIPASLGPSPLERASGLIIGHDLAGGDLPAPGGVSAALEAAVLPGLHRPPCLVSFSGGRDSSVVLAAATRAARRHGLPLPVPATLRFPGRPETEESAWQDRLVRTLALEDWWRLDLDEELDLVGSVAGRVLATTGVVWPPNAHFHVPLLDAADGGSLLTGLDGDGLLGAWRWARHGGRRPRLASMPTAVRGAVLRRRAPVPPWLRPTAARQVARRWADDAAAEPTRWDHRVARYRRQRSAGLAAATLAQLGEHRGTAVHHPLLDARVLSAVAGVGGRVGFSSRLTATRTLFAGLLPPDVLSRETKATFEGVFVGTATRAAVAGWSGTGIDDQIVDGPALARHWHHDGVDFRSAMLVQQVWLAANGDAP